LYYEVDFKIMRVTCYFSNHKYDTLYIYLSLPENLFSKEVDVLEISHRLEIKHFNNL